MSSCSSYDCFWWSSHLPHACSGHDTDDKSRCMCTILASLDTSKIDFKGWLCRSSSRKKLSFRDSFPAFWWLLRNENKKKSTLHLNFHVILLNHRKEYWIFWLSGINSYSSHAFFFAHALRESVDATAWHGSCIIQHYNQPKLSQVESHALPT